MTIVNLRGTNGSGKSSVARGLLAHGAAELELAEYRDAKGKPCRTKGYEVHDLGLIVVGEYRTACGGCDGISTQDQICDSVRYAAKLRPHVFFEGLLVSGLWSRYQALSAELGGLRWAFLDTPIEECLRRVYVRNGGKEIKEDLVRDKYEAVQSVRRKALAAGEAVVDVPHRKALTTVRRLFSCTEI